MKGIMLFIVSILSFSALFASVSPYKAEVDSSALSKIRGEYYHAVNSPDSVIKLIEYIEKKFGFNTSKYNPIILSYYAFLTGLRGKFDSNVYGKVKFVNQGIAKIDSAAALFPECFEIRFLRFSFYHFLPDFFKVSQKRREDLKFVSEMLMKKDYSFVPEKIQKDMISFIISTGRLDEETSGELMRAMK